MQITVRMMWIYIFINNTHLYVYKYKRYHTFIHISISILVSKSPSFTFFHMNIRLLITFFHGRFMYIHTFFHYKIMCSCRLATCLYHIQQTSYERRLHHSYVAPSVPIWAEFYARPRQYISIADSSRHACPELRCAAAIVYRHILLGENLHNLIRTRAHEKIQLDFFTSSHYMYCILLGKM